MAEYPMRVIARIHNDYTDKFAVPRQSGLVSEVVSRVVFEPEYRVREALRGLEGFSHLWLIWVFDRAAREEWSPTVRPPRLGGNVRMGVFATRSPFRPNPIAMSCVRLLEVREEPGLGQVLHVAGADLMNGTPILDIKPYLPYADSVPEASPGWTAEAGSGLLRVECPPEVEAACPEEARAGLWAVLAQDPRPRYQHDPERVYGFRFGALEVRFRVAGDVLTVTEILPAAPDAEP